MQTQTGRVTSMVHIESLHHVYQGNLRTAMSQSFFTLNTEVLNNPVHFYFKQQKVFFSIMYLSRRILPIVVTQRSRFLNTVLWHCHSKLIFNVWHKKETNIEISHSLFRVKVISVHVVMSKSKEQVPKRNWGAEIIVSTRKIENNCLCLEF